MLHAPWQSAKEGCAPEQKLLGIAVQHHQLDLDAGPATRTLLNEEEALTMTLIMMRSSRLC